MRKYSKILLFAILAVGMIASSAFAGTLKVNHGAATTPIIIGAETLGANRTISLTSPDGTAHNALNPTGLNGTIVLILGQSVAGGSLLNITFTGAQFAATTYVLCAQNSIGGVQASNLGNAVKVGGITFATATNGANIAIDTAAINGSYAAGNTIGLYTAATCAAANISNVTTLLYPANTASGMVTVTAALQTGGTTYDSASAANVANIMNQYSYGTVTATTPVIDYLGTFATNGTAFVAGDNITSSTTASNVVSAAVNYGVASIGGGANVSALLSLSDTTSFQGVSKIWLNTTGVACALATNIAANTAPAGLATINLAIPMANINQLLTASSNNVNLCIQVAQNAALTARTISAVQDIVVSGTGVNDIAAQTSGTTVMTWSVNGYQGVAPWLINNSAAPAYCIINNSGLTTANLMLNVLTTEGGTIPGTVSLGTLATGKSRTFMFGTDSVTEVTTGVTGTAIPITGLTAGARYSARFTATSAPASTQVNCVQTYSTGSRSVVPVLNANGGGTYLSQ